MLRRAVVLLALILPLPSASARAQSRGPVVPSFSGPATAPARLVATAAPEESLDLVGPTDAQKKRAEEAAKARVEAAAKAKVEAEARAKLDAEAKVKAQAQAKLDAEAKVKAQAKLDAEAKAKAEAQAKLDAEAKAKAEARAKLDAEAKAKAEAQAQQEREAATKAAEQARQAHSTDAQAKADEEQRVVIEAQVRAELEAKVTAEVQARLAARKAKSGKVLASDCLPDKKNKKGKKGRKNAKCLTTLPLELLAAAPAQAAAQAPAAAPSSDGTRRVMLAGSSVEPAPVAAPGVRLATASPVSMPAFDARSTSRFEPGNAPGTLAIPSDEGGRRRQRRYTVSDEFQVGPAGLLLNQLKAQGEIAPEVAVATFTYRWNRDEATAYHHGFFLGAESPACEAGAPCSLRLWANLGFSPTGEQSYLVDRRVAGQLKTTADRLAWSSLSARAGASARSSGGYGLKGEAQYQKVSLDYTRNANTTKERSAADLGQLKVAATGSLEKGAWAAQVSIAGNLYTGDSPDSTTDMPLRGVFMDLATFGFASAPQGMELRLEGRHEFPMGLAVSASYGFVTYAGTQWQSAQVFGARLAQKLGRFELGLGLAAQLDAPSVLPVGASSSDYSSVYGIGSVGAAF